MYDATNKGTVYVKWRELDFTPLLTSALKYVLRTMAIRGVSWADCHYWIQDFANIKPIRSELFRPKLTTNGLSWHTISRYPFNLDNKLDYVHFFLG
jgi:hypothetical protein